MDDREQAIRDEAAFLRGFAQASVSGSAKDGAILLAVGLIFGLVALQYWLIGLGVFHVSSALLPWLWLDGFLPFLAVLILLSRKSQGHAAGPASRALSAAWGGVGIAHVFGAIALIVGGKHLGLPLLTVWVFPLVLFTLFGAAWSVAFAARRRPFFVVNAIGSYLAAVICGSVMGQPEEWLVLSVGLFLLIALPGVVILRASSPRL